MIGSGIHALGPDKVAAIQNLEAPKSNKNVRSLLGLLSCYRSYFPTSYDINRPLIELIKKRAPNEVTWSKQCEKTYDSKQVISKSCLSQKDENEHEHPIAFISKKLSKCEEGYATIEKETLS